MKMHIMLSLMVMMLFSQFGFAADRPNFVWIVSEDNSIHYMRHFFPGGAACPEIEKMAEHGLTFNNAFSNAPVCSAARSTLATACYGPRIGTQFHRRYEKAVLAAGQRFWSAYLRDAGYYTTNKAKTDYNAVHGNDIWDESSGKASWRNRKDKSQPFYHMESHGISHEGQLHFSRTVYDTKETQHDPSQVKLADYFPDTPLFRYTHATYLDRMVAVDTIVGNVIAKLEEDGVLEDTFVFYFGDHGGVLPRSKGYIYDSGLHVPLVIRVPKNFKHLVDGPATGRVNGFVEFVDFGPTVMNLAGVKVPKLFDGKAFLGKGVTRKALDTRDESFGYADRFDEKYEFIRSLRKGNYQYIRYYQPWLPDGLQNNYRYKMLAFTEWRDLHNAGKLAGAAKKFFQTKPVEELYDCEADPHEINNLVADPQYQEVLLDLRARLQRRVKSLPDLSFYPESHLVPDVMSGDPTAFGQKNKKNIAKLVDIADLALRPFSKAKRGIRKALSSRDPLRRYWGVMAASAFGEQAKSLQGDITTLLSDKEEVVQMRAAEFLGIIGAINPQVPLTKLVNTTRNPVLATEALNSVVLFKDFYGGKFPVKRSDFRPVCNGADMDDRLNYINGVPYPPKAPGVRKARKKN